jgi:diguanylate cyclase (GGDEF)-like protein
MREVARSDEHGYRLVLLKLNLDDLKRVNDTYGYETGDRLLQEFACLLSSQLRRSDLLGRWSGAKFVALLHRMTPQLVEDLLVRLQKKFAAWQFEVNETERLNIRISAGYAIYGADGRSLPELARAASQRLSPQLSHHSSTRSSARRRLKIVSVPGGGLAL